MRALLGWIELLKSQRNEFHSPNKIATVTRYTDVNMMHGTTIEIRDDRKAELCRLFPEVVVQGNINLSHLCRLLGGSAASSREHYGLNWVGKSAAMEAVGQPSTGKLVPRPDQSHGPPAAPNLVVEGENLQVLKLLRRQYRDAVNMIYIDPPYNTGRPLMFEDNFAGNKTTRTRSVPTHDAAAHRTAELLVINRIHDGWLSFMYPRLAVARDLLREEGLLFCSISDREVHNLRHLLDDIFGEENFVAQLVWNTQGHTDNQFDVKVDHEYVVLYAKHWKSASLGFVVDPNTRPQSNLWKGFAENSITKNGPVNPPSEVHLPVGFPCTACRLDLPPSPVDSEFFVRVAKQGFISRSITSRFRVTYPVRRDAMVVRGGKLAAKCTLFSGWANVNKLKAFIDAGCRPMDDGTGGTLRFYLSDRGVIYYRRDRPQARHILSVLRNMGTTEQMRSELAALGLDFQYPKPKQLIKYLLQIGLKRDGLVLDFFAGSGTTAQAVLELNQQDGGTRSFHLVQQPEPLPQPQVLGDGTVLNTISEVCRERVQRVIAKLKQQHGRSASDGNGLQLDVGFRAMTLVEAR